MDRLYAGWTGQEVTSQTFATITTDANELLARIQDRMSVIIERADWPRWLGKGR